jgi:hypothetical protein
VTLLSTKSGASAFTGIKDEYGTIAGAATKDTSPVISFLLLTITDIDVSIE